MENRAVSGRFWTLDKLLFFHNRVRGEQHDIQ